MSDRTIATPAGSAHQIAFRGTIRCSALERTAGDVVIADGESAEFLPVRNGDVVVDGWRPTGDSLQRAVDAIRTSAPERVVAVGGGCAADTAKLAWLDCGTGDSRLVVVPCGRETWRSFAPFAVVLDASGGQATTVDPRLGTHDVVIDHGLLDAMTDDVVLLTALDMLVAAIESLLTRKAQPYSRAVASAAAIHLLSAIGPAVDGARPDPTSVIVASALAVEAFVSSGLGLAHGISTNLAALLQVPQDRINAIAGRWVLDRWGDRCDLDHLRQAAGFGDRRTRSIEDLVDACLARLGLNSLGGEGVDERDLDAVLPRINTSSGIPWLPDLLGAEEIRDVVVGLCDKDGKGVRARLG